MDSIFDQVRTLSDILQVQSIPHIIAWSAGSQETAQAFDKETQRLAWVKILAAKSIGPATNFSSNAAVIHMHALNHEAENEYDLR